MPGRPSCRYLYLTDLKAKEAVDRERCTLNKLHAKGDYPGTEFLFEKIKERKETKLRLEKQCPTMVKFYDIIYGAERTTEI